MNHFAMKKSNQFVGLALALLSVMALCLSGCGGPSKISGPAAKSSGAVASARPYTINGVTYYPLSKVDKYEERGMASWYGPNFHGKKTANGETYNMHGMTAAHKILPLNSTVRVTNLNNGKSTVLRVNDRGPFVEERVIDLSYAAAKELGVLGPGTAPVHVSLLRCGDNVYASSGSSSRPSSGSAGQAAPNASGRYYVQIGSFSVRENAQKLTSNMRREGYSGTRIKDNQSLWLVQVGVFNNLNQARKAQGDLTKRFPGSMIIAAD